MTTRTVWSGTLLILAGVIIMTSRVMTAKAGDFDKADQSRIVSECATIRETPAERDARMDWFRDAKLGMFIHWGLYSQLAGEWKGKQISGGVEWIQNFLGIPSSQYSPLDRTWKPDQYDARGWVRLMKAAGVRYVCITTKHHDGFCLWPTQMNNDWNIRITPGGKDLLRPLADACHEAGLQFCIYYSVMDWHHPDWPARPEFNDYAGTPPDKARYKKYLYGQLKERPIHSRALSCSRAASRSRSRANGRDARRSYRKSTSRTATSRRSGRDRKTRGTAGQR